MPMARRRTQCAYLRQCCNLQHERRSLSHTRDNTSKRDRGMNVPRVAQSCTTAREDNSNGLLTIKCSQPGNGEQS